jgi:hypothetical protein
MTDQELIRWARENHPDDPNIIEAGDPAETEATLLYIAGLLVAAENETGE